ncbi:hypothetical protein VC83_01566 [Pseudogymnoascus destructans]|uniref:DUF7924 domain-containing protein n=2 Tax=Pseudogymnoascus destructans TaxID=655981 RepID=L8FXM8_PSED2|nr:uncharacterized protein VC83_01566 [Pseudogymnoascus destructans]ELR05319.1 hypothetical protein GMDG_07302 [Pseudogymnoascus destructans 20631-21]OAF61948.1 hypothetical protein VC83_01566 [Pseudogymnoascus destructans]
MDHLLARKKSSYSLRRRQLEAGSVTTSEKSKALPIKMGVIKLFLPVEAALWANQNWAAQMQAKASVEPYLRRSRRNEARVVQDIARLIIPSAETLATFGSKHLGSLVESVNEGWNNSIPITQTRPQPDYAVGFGRKAFTEDQIKRLQPFVGELTDNSYFMATYYMYFPFLTCEVKCGGAALDVADRQNAHSMTMAVRGIVELFRPVKREKGLHREILAFSISHDHSSVRIYGHYPLAQNPAARKEGTVFRVTGLPASQPDDELNEALKAAIDDNLAGELWNAAIVPSCYDNEEKVALVEFHGGVPAFLSELMANPLGDWQLYTPKPGSPATADIIAITGLDGHAYGSWRGKGNLGRMWLRDFLSKDLPCCRTMINGYNSKLSTHGVDTIMDYSRGSIEELKQVRNTKELRKRPLFFIAHSFT